MSVHAPMSLYLYRKLVKNYKILVAFNRVLPYNTYNKYNKTYNFIEGVKMNREQICEEASYMIGISSARHIALKDGYIVFRTCAARHLLTPEECEKMLRHEVSASIKKCVLNM